ncbi:MAG: hypothetical protein SRB1_00745 [Desulfobacteraceae bacterium Eth-SRB1]|nr:MAG: hypothetical protein SRB1_00745 [Desulfobacteraceae bacterium Eth-SRB1]
MALFTQLKEHCNITNDKDNPIELKKPKELTADSLYGSDDNCERAKEHDVELIAPTMGSVEEDKLSLAVFQFSEKGKVGAPGETPLQKLKREKESALDLLHMIAGTVLNYRDALLRKGGNITTSGLLIKIFPS